MLLHAMQMWPDIVTSEFWSYAFLHAVHLHNCTPWSNESKSPFTLFTNEDMNHTPNDFRVFRSPVYVLDPTLQSGALSPGKWKERSYQGIYIGHSPHHASNVIIVYNPKTWLVSPQYHAVHDELLETVQINNLKQRCNEHWMRCSTLYSSHLDGYTVMHIHQLWSFNHITPLSQQQLGFCQWNHPCYSSEETCLWLITSKHCRLWGRYSQHKSCSSTVLNHLWDRRAILHL